MNFVISHFNKNFREIDASLSLGIVKMFAAVITLVSWKYHRTPSQLLEEIPKVFPGEFQLSHDPSPISLGLRIPGVWPAVSIQ